jgi:putative membrane protein
LNHFPIRVIAWWSLKTMFSKAIIGKTLIAFVALQHIGFLVLEMFFWTKPLGMRVFNLTPELAEQSAALAMNQGLYNGFLAAGLIWSLARKEGAYGTQVFFLSCVVVAGVFGAITAKPSILFVQAAPALLALVLVMLARRDAQQ